MAVLEKIRVKLGAFITLIIGVALLSFIVDADTLQSAISMFSSKYDVGEMNGKSIKYQEFQKKIDYFTQIQQILSGSATMDEQTQEMVNQGAWQDYLNEEVIIPQIENSGVSVGDEEMVDLTQGKYIYLPYCRENVHLQVPTDSLTERLFCSLSKPYHRTKPVISTPTGDTWRTI